MSGSVVSPSVVPWLLEVSGLRKAFGGVAALSDGQFKLKPGSVHALCGGNGAGKSTFLPGRSKA